MSTPPGPFRRFLGAFWSAVDATRRFTFNLLFLLVVLLFALALLTGGSRPHVQENTALVVDLRGAIVEQYTGSAREASLSEALGGEVRETQLRDVLAGIDAAAQDAKIGRMVLLLDDLGHTGLAQLREISAAIGRFRAAGKKVVAWGSNLEQRRYYLAAQADEVYLDPMGSVGLDGFGGYRNYYHDALERIGVSVHVYRAGKYKSFGETYTNSAPSPESLEEDAALLGDVWGGFAADIEKARKLEKGAVGHWIDERADRLAAVGGDAARLALESRLVDGLKTRSELREYLIGLGVADEEHKTFRQVALGDYAAGLVEASERNAAIGIVVAEGGISDGEEAQGAIGGRSTAAIIRKAREDDAIRAIVLRVDSPGGSAYGSELIRRELELTRKAGKPVVVSMGNVAASGGYWISTSADRVFADPGTITGSIGVFSLFPTVERSMDRLGIHTGGATTNWPAGAFDVRRPVDPRLEKELRSQVLHTYDEFLARVGKAHEMTPAQADEVGQGRVWTGRQALDRRLVDELGGLAAAVKTAASLAKIDPASHARYLESESAGWGHLLGSLPHAWLRAAVDERVRALPGAAVLLAAERDLAWIGRDAAAAQPFAHCLCAAP